MLIPCVRRQEDAQEAAARRQRGAEEETAEDVWARRNQQAPSQRGWQALRRAHVDDASERVAANSECFICMDAPCTRKLRCGHQVRVKGGRFTCGKDFELPGAALRWSAPHATPAQAPSRCVRPACMWQRL